MKVRRLLLICILGILPGSATAAAQELEQELKGLLYRFSEDPDWTLLEKPEEFNPANLFEYMDGAAPQYLSFGFRKLFHARYAFQGDELSSVVADVFEMENSTGAYGIYTSGRHQSASPEPWGVEGYRSGTVAAAWKGRIYVHASADDSRPALLGMLESIVRRLAAAVPGDAARPVMLENFPEGFIANSDRFVGKDLFGHTFLPCGFMVSYRTGTPESQLFITPFNSAEEAKAAFQRFREYESDLRGNPKPEPEPGFSRDSFWADDPGLGRGFVSRYGGYLVGVWGVGERQVGLRLVRETINHLRAPR